MKLLLDANLSPNVVDELMAEYPESRHVDQGGLHGERDDRIRSFARDHDFVLVSKDSDFREPAAAHSAPPKVERLAVGDTGTSAMRKLLLESRARLEGFRGRARGGLSRTRPGGGRPRVKRRRTPGVKGILARWDAVVSRK